MFAFPSTATLPATKSHEARGVYFTRNLDATQLHDGTLQVVESVGQRKARLITETYLIQEEPAIGFTGRQFLVVKDATKGWEGTLKGHDAANRVGNVYQCRVFSNGTGTCNCTAGDTKSGDCVHFLALRELIATGGLESPFEYLPPAPVEDIGDELLARMPATFDAGGSETDLVDTGALYGAESEADTPVVVEWNAKAIVNDWSWMPPDQEIF